jgi:hypothetical protein
MKKTVINLTAIERIDAMPLRKAVEYLKKGRDEIDSARVREKLLKEEVEKFLATTDLDDEKSLQLVSGKKIQAEIIPNLIARVERNLNEKALPTLLAETDQFKSALLRFYQSAYDATAEQIAEQFRGYFSDPEKALRVARDTDDCWAINARIRQAGLIHIPTQGAPRVTEAAAVKNLIQSAEDLLAIAGRA